jgi:predicted TPR repeat methyltransferase
MKEEKIDDALNEFLIIEKSEPYHFETQSNIAVCYLKKGLLNDAKMHYKNALKLLPNDAETLFNLGVIETRLGNTDDAIPHYQKAVLMNPDFFDAHNNLGVLFIEKQHPEFALRHFQEALRLQPDNTSIQYTVNALSQNQREASAPSDYIKSLFDSYADHYDEHLLTALDYQVPAHFERLLKKTHAPESAWDMLDLGCGTGLCGALLKPFAKTLTGVDLSPKMLEAARAKNRYDSLECEDLGTFLNNKHAAYDVIIAGDVMVYMGKLDFFFQQISQALRPSGLFLFNTEISENENYAMNQSGRFSHQKKYIETLANENHLERIHYEKVVTRLQNNEPVYGHLYVFKKPD